ncbi:MAG: hypothetical protein B7733_24420 [Myxococcales bacterium FL481]|nr:MAG: hypothetical protein B7733_24420 [Myxococcales bacterium FL481]
MERSKHPTQRAKQRRPWPAGFGLAIGLLAGACGENHHDVYLEALKIEGDAERHQCRLGFDPETNNNTLSSDRAANCLYELRRAQARYEHARSLGAKGRDIELKLEDIDTKIKRLEGMVETISAIERDQKLSP